MGSIPLVDLAAQHAEIASEVAVGWQEILDRTAFVGGPKVTAFARRNGARAGFLGDVAATSFYPGKNLGAYGDAGAVLTDSAAVATRIRMIRDHGSPRKYEQELLGFNSRMDAIQAVVLSARLRRLDKWNEGRRAAAARYGELLGVTLPRTMEGNEHVWHLYVVRVADRDRVLKELQAAGVDAGIHYPVPLHLTGAYAGLGYAEGTFPIAERASREILSLPLFAGITPDQQECVASALRVAVR